jgi:hypothetical protein
MTKFEYIMNRIASRHGVHSLFSDLLELLIYAFSGGRKEKEYLELINKYEKPEAYTISEAMAALVVEMTGDGDGMVDVLGKYFEENVCSGTDRAIFTPQNICDRMARIQNPTHSKQHITIDDCGSGRMLMGFAKVNRFAKFYGTDKNANCAKIAVINLCMNGMYGEIAWVNSISNTICAVWEIYPSLKGYPCIKQIPKQLSYVHLKLTERQKKSQLLNVNSLSYEIGFRDAEVVRADVVT